MQPTLTVLSGPPAGHLFPLGPATYLHRLINKLDLREGLREDS